MYDIGTDVFGNEKPSSNNADSYFLVKGQYDQHKCITKRIINSMRSCGFVDGLIVSTIKGLLEFFFFFFQLIGFQCAPKIRRKHWYGLNKKINWMFDWFRFTAREVGPSSILKMLLMVSCLKLYLCLFFYFFFLRIAI